MHVSDNATRFQNSVQNLTIDYPTDTNGNVPSMNYNETGGYKGNLAYVYDNYGNISDLLKDNGNSAKAILINPNNGAIDTRYNPHDIDDLFTYRASDGFMSIGDLWANNDDGTVYLQGHPVIPNPWGDVSINKTDTATTTYTTEITTKDGGDDAEPCRSPCYISCKQSCREIGDNYEDCPSKDGIKEIIFDSNCSKKDMCDKLTECKDKITNIIDNHNGCLQSYWWIYPSCYSSYYKEFRGISTSEARTFQGDYRRLCNAFGC